ncbi:ATP-binding protein [Mycolicibacterium fluoranthenivorans]|uniref:Putative ATPase/class 3 adenylate cyclase n=1 Tax=Mycolicibacterium fluoranthenivorans TaxID=258505 RepID=A0A7X5U363_9MYCO|nr:adenylate/guanylate cyclase domain-containing protein [Mycolicibacterium fluoranthenivorans]MCV7358607.1 adenylate/guanylate cyclase domain-containing protein [Mycolicibacterium fluoranthenivorans]NIH97561.1 putative ATPase/class 3 adenylate cyclase [Mycolicibacterium fluoranthenivorans]
MSTTVLPTGTVTLLMADVEGSTRSWEVQPEAMAAAMSGLDRSLSELVDVHRGVCPTAQGEGDSFVIAFTRASDAVACALALQQAVLAPIRLRIGLHSGEIQLRDQGNYMGQTINRAARLRDIAVGGQTLMSGTTSDLAGESLPEDAWLIDLGRHPLRDITRPERVSQLCHPSLSINVPPLRADRDDVLHWRPVQLTSFVGRSCELAEIAKLLAECRLLTLTGAGGVGKTRLAVAAADHTAELFEDGVRCVELAAVTDPDMVPQAVAQALGLSDPRGRCATPDVLTRTIGDRRLLLVVDNCEHLLDAAAALVGEILRSCPNVTVLATSREPLAVGGEQVWRVPSMSLDDDAVALFTERAQRARAEFVLDTHATEVVREICRRLDGMPLAIELAASRVRALTLDEIIGSLHDRFRLLTGGCRTVARRQQTLKACIDWSYTLLNEHEKAVLRRVSVVPGGFDMHTARTVAVGGDVCAFQVVDLLMSLVDKSLLSAETRCGRTRYRLSETMRQYARDRHAETGEPDLLGVSPLRC